jgi:molybdenum storage protein
VKVYAPIQVMPDVTVVKIGGQSIIDRGRDALYPVLSELRQAKAHGAKLVVLAGGGTRARHLYSIASELDLPTGVLAALGKYVPMQNARILQMLLANDGGIFITTDDFGQLPLHLAMGCIPIMGGMPPFGYWEKRENGSRVPPHRTDAGAYLTAEFLGVKRCVFVKDEDGLFTDDPKKNKDARHIPWITARALEQENLNDVVVERVVVEYMQRALDCRELQIVNGLTPGHTYAALTGDTSRGSLITSS